MSTPRDIVTLAVGAFESNCYLVCGARACLLIDPGEDLARIEAELARREARVEAVLLTHGHADHVHALSGLLARHPAPVYLHPADAVWAFGEANRIPPWYDTPPARPDDLRPVTAMEPLAFDEMAVHVIETPGHSPGSVCYHVPDWNTLFSGDTLFRGSIGRTDLPGSDPEAMRASLTGLTSLPPATRVYPGHGAPTTIAEERRTNLFLRDL